MKQLDRIAWLVSGSFLAGGVLALGPIGGGLEPPVGVVSDTTPSLADLSTQITSIEAGLASSLSSDLQVSFGAVGGGSPSNVEFVSTDEADFIRVHSVVVSASVSNMLVGDSQETILFAGGSAVLDSGQLRGTSQVLMGGLRVPTPVRFLSSGSPGASIVSILYWIDD